MLPPTNTLRANRPRAILTGLLAAAVLLAASGCGSHEPAVSPPAGVKVGGPLTPAQVHAIQAKRQGNGSPPVQ